MNEMSPYGKRSEKHGERNTQSKIIRRTRWIITAALVLTASSLALTAVAVAPLINKSLPHKSSTRVVIPAKLASAGETEKGQSVNLANSQQTTEPTVTPADSNSTPAESSNTQAEPKGTPSKEDGASQTAESDPAPATPAAQPAVETKSPAQQDKKTKSTVKPKVIYLTFDDGPSKYTEQLLDILEHYQIHGTFFMIGNQLSKNEKIVNQALQEGHYIGLHSMTHNKKILYDGKGSAHFIEEFTKEQKLMEKLTGTSPTLIRAPYGSKPEIGEKFRGDIAKAGFKMWDWTVDSMDWKYPNSPSTILKEVKRQTHRDTEVILLHEKAQTVKILPQIIEYLQSKGYAFAVYKPNQHFTVNFGNDPRL